MVTMKNADIQYQCKSGPRTVSDIYEKTMSAVQMNGSMKEWFRITVEYACRLSSNFLIFSKGLSVMLRKNII